MAEDDGYSDGSESNFSSSRNQQKRETQCKNDVRFLRNTTCMGGSSERHEVLETGRRCDIGGQLQRGDDSALLIDLGDRG
ncbi:hypothetical protein DY000_02025053 [Brassica cretica]|uniref:Uncharacterized protein n=1 Tax=Brassica cretica TaxID=69181 RepID=A0ABQ7E0Y0_BRACR|nr:hypothetical protein DY000_02025053 [Brassica cretica]